MTVLSCDESAGCDCECHTMPGVDHIVPCCDRPPFDDPSNGAWICEASGLPEGKCACPPKYHRMHPFIWVPK